METIYLKIVEEVDIPRLDLEIGRRIYQAIENKLRTQPFLYGLPLRGKLHKFWKLRVGDYRIIYTVLKKRIVILAIGHRRDVYNIILKRI